MMVTNLVMKDFPLSAYEIHQREIEQSQRNWHLAQNIVYGTLTAIAFVALCISKDYDKPVHQN